MNDLKNESEIVVHDIGIGFISDLLKESEDAYTITDDSKTRRTWKAH